MSLNALGLMEAAAGIRDGRLSSAELVGDCLKRIDEVDRDIQAWAFLDRDHAMRQAEAADDFRKQGKAVGNIAGRSAKSFGQTVDLERDIEDMYFFRKNVVLEFSRKVHDPIISQ